MIDGKQLAAIGAEILKKQLAIWSDPKASVPFLTRLF
jgi:hypothetical protein